MPTVDTGLSQRGLNGTFFSRFKETPTLWRELCALIKSDGVGETYKWLGQLPMPNEWKGKRRSQALRDFGMLLQNRHWEATLPVDRDELADDQTGQLALRVGEMAARFAQHPDKLLIELIEAGESTVCYDGQYFFDTDHAEGVSGSQSNLLTHDVTTPASPTEAEFEAAFWLAIQAMVKFVDDHGEPWNAFTSMEQLDGLLVVVPPNMLRVASKVLGAHAAGVIGGDTNILAGKSKVTTSARLSWTTKFAVFKVDDAMRPFIFQDRQPVKTEIKDDPEDKEILYMADARYAAGYGLPLKAVLVSLT